MTAATTSRTRLGVLVGIAVLALAGLLLVTVGLAGGGAARATAPAVDAVTRPPVALPGPQPAPGPAPGPAPASAPVSAGVPASPPRDIDIPAIGVRSVVDVTGLNPDGSLAVPVPGPRYDHAAWYDGSATPGQSGPSVILGHIDSAANGPSVFYRLSQLRPLDELGVTRQDGRTVRYRVNSVRQYAKNAFPTAEVYGPTPRPELRLITCGGSFDDTARSYRDNTVVYASEVDD